MIAMRKIFGYQTCFVRAGTINISSGTLYLSAMLRTFGIIQNGGKHTITCVPSYVDDYERERERQRERERGRERGREREEREGVWLT